MNVTVDVLPILSAVEASVELADGTQLLDRTRLHINAGELVAIVGPSGAGKTTLLQVLAGVRPPTSGLLERRSPSTAIGFVPQDDIVHRELTVESTLRYSAQLRLPAGTSPGDVGQVVDRTLAALGLTERRHLAVGALSGGQRKRASIATELVVRPEVCLLDEPTAGLDPTAAAALMDVLRSLVEHGTAIVMTTHNLADARVADRLIVMAEGGRIVFDGPPAASGIELGGVPPGSGAASSQIGIRGRIVPARGTIEPPIRPLGDGPVRGTPHGKLGQARILARRNTELIVRNRMSAAIMAGSPVLIIGMFVALFHANAFAPDAVDASAPISIVYWLAFAGFFFGLTFGLLQVTTELPVVKRERLSTIGLGPYLVAKLVVLVPVLGVVDLMMLAVLRLLDRLPATGLHDTFLAWTVLLLDAGAGLTLGLLASATVASPAQAALALPMLCFPAVLFSGAVLPVSSMAPIGRTIASVMSDRWAFEALARSLHLGDAPAGSPSRRLVDLHDGALSGPIGAHLLALLALMVASGVAARVVLDRRAR